MKFIDKYFSYIVNGIITTIIVLAGMLVIKSKMPPQIVKIDLVEITTHSTQIMAVDTFTNKTMDLNNPAVKKISDTIKTNLEPVITEYAKQHHVVVVQAQALVDPNVPDITQEIINQLDRKIK